MKKMCAVFAAFVLMSHIVFAEETFVKPYWFVFMEPLGVIVGIAAAFYFYKNIRKVGGEVRRSYNYKIEMLLLFIAALLLRSFTENGFIEESLLTETIFELLLYAGIIMVALASRVLNKAISAPKKK